MKSTKRNLIAVAGIALGLLLPLRARAGEGDNVLRSLAAEWWQWALSIPPSENPLLDPTGADCFVGQRGPVWFLGGAFNGGAVTRSCSVPAGKAIFFPIANASFFDSPGICGQGAEHFSAAEMRTALAGFMAGMTGVSAELDGVPVAQVHRVRSRVFEVALPEDNLLDPACAEAGGSPAGIFSPTVDDGYYVLLAPLAAGRHTLRFQAANPEIGFAVDTTYNLTVVPVSRK